MGYSPGRSKATKGNGSYGLFSSWTYRFKIVIKAAAFSSGETDFSVLIDDLVWPAAAWQYMEASGGDIRASSDIQGVNQLGVGLLALDVPGEKISAEIGVISVSSVVDVPIYLFVGKAGAVQPAAGASGGRESCIDSICKGYWPCQEAGANIEDFTSQNNDGTKTAPVGTTSSTPIYGTALDFTGGYIDMGTPAILRFTQKFTMEFWAYIDSKSDYDAMLHYMFDTGTTESGYSLYADSFYDPNGWDFSVFTTTRDFAGAAIAPGAWKHIQCYNDGSNIKMRVNGGEIASDTSNGNIDWSPIPLGFYLGRYNDDDEDWRFDGKMQQVKVSSDNRSINWLDAVNENETLVTDVIELKPFVT